MSSMRVVHVNSMLSGGAARAVQRIHEGLALLDCDSRVYTLSDEYPGFDGVVRYRAARDPLSRIMQRMRAWRIGRDFSPYRSSRPSGLELFSDDRTPFFSDVLRQCPPADLIHLHWVAGFVDYAFFFSMVQKPVVWTMHDMNAFTGGCHYNIDCQGFARSCGCCPQLGSEQSDDLSLDVMRRKADAFSKLRSGQLHIVATSQWMRGEVEASALFSQIPVSVIPLALDTSIFKPSEGKAMRSVLGVPERAKVVLFAAESVSNRRKGFAELLQALDGLDVEGELYLLTLGGGAPDLGGGFRHLHIGHLKNDHLMAAVYSAADVFVMPSLQEAFGQTALEAMACGTPVAAFDAGGIPDMVRPGVTGMLAPKGDAPELRRCIARLLQESAEVRGMSTACREVVLQEYDLRMQAARYMELYQSMRV